MDVIYFSENNWMSGTNYPPTENFKKWLRDDLNQSFRSDAWCKENKLCVYYGWVDMSANYTISASREWVEKNCPELLTDDEYTYITRIGKYQYKEELKDTELVWEDIEHNKKYSDFVYIPEDGEDLPDNDHIGNMPFREYCEENFGCEYYETYWWKDDEDDEDSDEDNEIDG